MLRENAGKNCRLPRLLVRPHCGGSLSVVHEMTLVQDLCAGAHQRGRCSFAWWPQKATGHPTASARTQSASAAGVATIHAAVMRLVNTGRSRSVAFILPSHTIVPPRTCSPGRNRSPHTDTSKRGGTEAAANAPKRHPPARPGRPRQSLESVRPAPRAPVAPKKRYGSTCAPRVPTRLQHFGLSVLRQGRPPAPPACTSAPTPTTPGPHAPLEIFNAVDERLTRDRRAPAPRLLASVADNGRGIPVDIVPVRADGRRRFASSTPAVSSAALPTWPRAALHVGASVVNALSARLDVRN